MAPRLRSSKLVQRNAQIAPQGRRSGCRGRAGFRPRIEALEALTMPAVVTWINPVGGAWEVASNWSKDGVPALPGPADDVVIDAPGAIITHRSDPTTIHSLTDNARIDFTGGSLTLFSPVGVLNTINNTLNFSGGTIGGPGDLALTGPLNWTNGTMGGTGTTDANGGVDFGGNATKTLDGRTLNKNGVGIWTGGGQIFLNDGATFNNNGTLAAQSDAFLGTTSGILGAFNNAGTFLKTAGLGTTTVAVPFFNTGAVDVQAGTLALTGGGSGSGSFTVEAPATLRLASVYYRLDPASSVAGDGNVSVAPGTFSFTGTLDVFGSYAINGITAVASGTTVNFLNDASTGALTNAGTVNLGGGTAFTAAGAYTQGSGAVTNLFGGTLTAGGGVAIASDGRFTGLGTINASVTNAGHLSPGTPTTTGILRVNGDYTQASTGTLFIKLGGLAPGDQYDQLNVSGLATLAGTLNISLINGFSPAVGDTFIILTYASRSGTFSTVTGVNLFGRRLNPVYQPTELDLVTVPA